MTQVFVDTAAWIALFDSSDSLHADAQQVMQNLHQARRPLLTTAFVMVEVASAFAAPPYRQQIIAFVNGISRVSAVTILDADHSWYAAGWQLYQQRLDKAWSLTDCISFAVMHHYDLTDAFTSDRHFEQAGFRRLLIPS